MKKLLIILLFSCGKLAHAQHQSSLPIMIIDTKGVQIVDEPKITATLKIINNASGLNKSTDKATDYDGMIGIEYRGSSSQGFPKKPFGIETWSKPLADTSIAIFGWPKESDWILYPSYNEKSLMQNVLTMDLARGMGLYASRTKYVDVLLNGEYIGLYVFMEKIKRDEGRVDISNLKTTDIKGDDLTGGYILKVDKGTGINQGSFNSKYGNSGNPNNFSSYYYDSPKEINSIQKDYIKNWIWDFEKVLKSENFADPISGYRKYIDVSTFIKFFILNEVARGVDSYRISTYYYKDKDSKNPKLKAGPPWDFDIAYGNANYCQGDRHDMWSYKFNNVCPNDFWLVPFWWEKLMSDPGFISELRTEYFKQRETGELNAAKIKSYIDSYENILKVPQKKNFERWPVLGVYVWPNPNPIASSWEMEVLELRNWMDKRLKWLDANIPAVYTSLETDGISSFDYQAFPNPFLETISVKINSDKNQSSNFSLISLKGETVFQSEENLNAGENIINLKVPVEYIGSGLYLLKCKIGNSILTKKLIKNN
jgi:hypothetical protein